MPPHSDPEELALRALGEEPPEGADDSHLAECSLCRSELDQLRAVVAAARQVEPEDHPVGPPATVWASVAAELGLPDPTADARAEPGVTGAADGRAAGPHGRGVPSGGRRFGPAALAAAAVLGLVLGAAGALLVTRDGAGNDTATVLAAAELRFVVSDELSGDAELLLTSAGRRLELDVSGLPAADGFHEVWLLDRDAQRLVSLGLLVGGSGRFTLPDDLDVGEYPVVDVSVEPADGDPGHSGDSVVRGVLSG